MPAARTLRPARFLRALVVAGAVAASTAALPGVALADEPGSTVTGRLVQAVPETEHHDHEAPEPLAWVETAEGAVPVAGADVEHLPAGAQVQLTVAGEAEEATAEEPADVLRTDSATPPPSPAPLPGPVTNEVTVAVVTPVGTTADPAAAADVAALVAGPVAQFWSAQTGGAIRIGVGAVVEITTGTACSDARALWTTTAEQVGFRPGPGKHLLLHVVGDHSCSYALAEMGSGPGSGGRLYVTEERGKGERLASSIAHELGHNFGLHHSSALQCDGAVETGDCRTAGYRDYYDVMGYSWAQLGSLNAAQAARLGVLTAAEAPQLSVRDAAATVTLAPLSAAGGPRALRLTDAEGTDYWLEYRTATGQDAWLGTGADRRKLQTGVLVRRSAGWPDTAVLLDGTPSAAAGWDDDHQSALPVGVPVPLSGGDFTVTLRSVTAAGAVLEVVPTAPATSAGSAAGSAAGAAAAPSAPSAPRSSTAGRVLPGTGPAAATPELPEVPAEASVPVPWVPTVDVSALSRSPELEPAADAVSGSGLLVAAAGAGLAGATLLVARRMRAARLR